MALCQLVNLCQPYKWIINCFLVEEVDFREDQQGLKWTTGHTDLVTFKGEEIEDNGFFSFD